MDYVLYCMYYVIFVGRKWRLSPGEMAEWLITPVFPTGIVLYHSRGFQSRWDTPTLGVLLVQCFWIGLAEPLSRNHKNGSAIPPIEPEQQKQEIKKSKLRLQHSWKEPQGA